MTSPREHVLTASKAKQISKLLQERYLFKVLNRQLEQENAQMSADNARLILENSKRAETIEEMEARIHELGNKAHIATFRVDLLRDALIAAIDGMRHAERHYLSTSAAAEMWAHCNGYEGTVDALEILSMTEDKREKAT